MHAVNVYFFMLIQITVSFKLHTFVIIMCTCTYLVKVQGNYVYHYTNLTFVRPSVRLCVRAGGHGKPFDPY